MRLKLAAALLLLLAPLAEAQLADCTVIPSIPWTISVNGKYCLTQRLNANLSSGAGITIAAAKVTLDLNGYSLTNATSGFGTTAVGILAQSGSEGPCPNGTCKNLVIRNGTLRGWHTGVELLDSSGSANLGRDQLVEDVRVERSTHVGIHAQGLGIIIRRSVVVETACADESCPSPAGVDNVGIWLEGAQGRVLGNDVANVEGSNSAISVLVQNASGTVVEGNRVGNIAALGVGLKVDAAMDVLALGNRFLTLAAAIAFSSSASGAYADNIAIGVASCYSGGTDLGNNR